MKNSASHARETGLLGDMLTLAAQLEHSLLNCYLYTACSIKSTPQEFATLSNGKPNIRKAIHFEKARQWKQSVLGVSHEEMLHLHYVQCLLRALDKPPYFHLPDRNPDTGGWVIRNWDIYTGATNEEDGGTQIPLAGLTIEQIKQFILFESTDSLQDDNPFGDKVMGLFKRLYEFEIDVHLESILYNIADEAQRKALKAKLKHIYCEVLPSDEAELVRALAAVEEEYPEIGYVRFQSIGDFYLKGILPLYQQAFDKKLVKNSNLTFYNELLGPAAAEGFLPVGPVYRSKNYTDFANANTENPLRYFKNVNDVVKEIVEEGEGFSSFEDMAETFLAKIEEIGGTRKYLEYWKIDQNNSRNKDYSTPQWLADTELCRQSHLYRFVVIFMDMEFEKALSAKVNVDFAPCRPHMTPKAEHHSLQKMIDEMPKQFNACYLVMLLWLSRIYEVKHWQSDKDRRYAIEMLATWPMMSLAIRPFLELISFFPVDMKDLFRLDKTGMPSLPPEALQLVSYLENTDRSEAINHEIDYLALRVLANVSQWAAAQIGVVESYYEDERAAMAVTRLKALSGLNEFEKQFPFREHGGYSNQLPDLTYQQEFPDAAIYSEDPSTLGSVFENSLVLRLRFGGFGLVQLSTDPDPPTDEAGCSGTHMLNAADGDKKFDRSIVWQHSAPAHDIVRPPSDRLPQVGVNLIDFALQVADPGGATAGVVPLQIMQSVGAVQTSGVQQQLKLDGLMDLCSFAAAEVTPQGAPIRINLLEKDGIRPVLYGENHLVSKDGEPIDPFVISVTDSQYNPIFQREIYNEGHTMQEMNPLQRLYTARWPTGFDGAVTNLPPWLTDALPEDYLANLNNGPNAYLKARSLVLYDQLNSLNLLDVGSPSQSLVDQFTSYAERLFRITFPRSTTVGWLGIMLHYGHSVSGNLVAGPSDNLLARFITEKLGLQITEDPAEADRTKANSRWVIKYTQGYLDTDAISELVFGELYIPVRALPSGTPFRLSKKWTFAMGMGTLVADYACVFGKPFWGSYTVEGKQRTTHLGPAFHNVVITDTLLAAGTGGYKYASAGVPGISDFLGSFQVDEQPDGTVQLEAMVSYRFADAESCAAMATILGSFFSAMSAALTNQFAPK